MERYFTFDPKREPISEHNKCSSTLLINIFYAVNLRSTKQCIICAQEKTHLLFFGIKKYNYFFIFYYYLL